MEFWNQVGQCTNGLLTREKCDAANMQCGVASGPLKVSLKLTAKEGKALGGQGAVALDCCGITVSSETVHEMASSEG